MPTQLIFATTTEMDNRLASSVEAGLRRQLTGLRLDQAARGTFFEIRGPGIPAPGVRVQLQGVPERGVSVGPETAFVINGSAPLTARLRGRSWLSDWSRRHYGRVISAALDANRSTPLLLLLGDPGTGKSVVAQHVPILVARRLRHPVISIQLSERLRGSGIQGRAGSELVSAVDAIGRMSIQTQMPAVVFLDEAESVAGTRAAADGSSGAQENVAVVDALITGIDRVFRHGDARLVFIMASNLSERIDPAVRRRAMVYQFTRPSDDERRTILSRSLGEILDIRTLDDLNRALRRQGVVLTAADVLNQVIAPAIWESAHHDRSIDAERLLALAAQAVATPAVAQG